MRRSARRGKAERRRSRFSSQLLRPSFATARSAHPSGRRLAYDGSTRDVEWSVRCWDETESARRQRSSSPLDGFNGRDRGAPPHSEPDSTNHSSSSVASRDSASGRTRRVRRDRWRQDSQAEEPSQLHDQWRLSRPERRFGRSIEIALDRGSRSAGRDPDATVSRSPRHGPNCVVVQADSFALDAACIRRASGRRRRRGLEVSSCASRVRFPRRRCNSVRPRRGETRFGCVLSVLAATSSRQCADIRRDEQGVVNAFDFDRVVDEPLDASNPSSTSSSSRHRRSNQSRNDNLDRPRISLRPGLGPGATG